MTENFNAPLNCKPFHQVFLSFVDAHSAEYSEPGAPWTLQVWQAAQDGLEKVFDDFCYVLRYLDGAVIVLAQGNFDFQRVDPSILLRAETLPAMLGKLILKRDQTTSLPIGKGYDDAIMYLPEDVVEALHRQFPRMGETPPLKERWVVTLDLPPDGISAWLPSPPALPDHHTEPGSGNKPKTKRATKPPGESTGVARRRQGRPPVEFPAAKAAYDAVHPNGHGNMPFGHVWNSIEERAGRKFKERTVRRVLATAKAEREAAAEGLPEVDMSSGRNT